MDQSTQETQIASQYYSQRLEDEPDNTNCWGLLWPINSKDNSRPKPWRFNKDKPIYTVGRSNASDVKIVSQIISSTHCHIEWDGTDGPNAGITITDVSRNGTFVKGSKIAKNIASLLHDGDEVAFGVAISNQNGESHRYTFRMPIVRAALKGIHVNYELQNELGRGSFAAVVKALHKPTGRFFAVKIIPKPQSLLQPQTVKMLEREMAILRKLHHTYIVNLFEVVPSETDLCLVMELVSGGDLFDYITKRGYLSEDLSGQLTAELCDAMAYIHYQGITHRDLKPENILLTNDDPPHVKVADFGLAKCVNSKTMLKTMCGTPSYLAPEVVLQENGAGYDQKVDSWSAGAIVFAMLTGQGAFNENENRPLAQRVRERQVVWEYMEERECSRESMDFVDKLMKFSSAERMSLTEALAHPWLKPRYWPSGLPSYFTQGEVPHTPLSDVPPSFVGSVMSADGPATAPTPDEMVGVSEGFQSLELENDSISDSPAFIDFDDEVGGPSELTRSQDLKRAIEEREQSWDLVEETGDPEQTPLARPRLQLLDDERTARPRPPAVITDIQGQVPPPAPPGPKRRNKRKLSSDEMITPGGASSPGQEARGVGRLGPRKASKASQYDTPTTATRGRFANGMDRKTSLRSSRGKGPIARDYAEEDDEE